MTHVSFALSCHPSSSRPHADPANPPSASSLPRRHRPPSRHRLRQLHRSRKQHHRRRHRPRLRRRHRRPTGRRHLLRRAVEAINAITSTGTSVSLLSGTPTVDFARFNGLQTLLDMNDVPVGTYTSVTHHPRPRHHRLPQHLSGAAPAIATEAATYTTPHNLHHQHPPRLAAHRRRGPPVGLHFDFDLAQVHPGRLRRARSPARSPPTFDLSAVGHRRLRRLHRPVRRRRSQRQHHRAVLRRRRARTAVSSPSTSTATPSGTTARASAPSPPAASSASPASSTALDATIDADEVAILSQNAFYADGQVTYVTPASGAATSFDLYVRGLLPTTTGLTLGQIAQVNLTGSEKFFIYRMHNPLTQFLFNSSALLPGQDVAIGGPASGATNPNAVTVNRVVPAPLGL